MHKGFVLHIRVQNMGELLRSVDAASQESVERLSFTLEMFFKTVVKTLGPGPEVIKLNSDHLFAIWNLRGVVGEEELCGLLREHLRSALEVKRKVGKFFHEETRIVSFVGGELVDYCSFQLGKDAKGARFHFPVDSRLESPLNGGEYNMTREEVVVTDHVWKLVHKNFETECIPMLEAARDTFFALLRELHAPPRRPKTPTVRKESIPSDVAPLIRRFVAEENERWFAEFRPTLLFAFKVTSNSALQNVAHHVQNVLQLLRSFIQLNEGTLYHLNFSRGANEIQATVLVDDRSKGFAELIGELNAATEQLQLHSYVVTVAVFGDSFLRKIIGVKGLYYDVHFLAGVVAKWREFLFARTDRSRSVVIVDENIAGSIAAYCHLTQSRFVGFCEVRPLVDGMSLARSRDVNPIIFGLNDELNSLRRIWREFLNKGLKTRFVMLSGEVGAGKRTLRQAFLNEAQGDIDNIGRAWLNAETINIVEVTPHRSAKPLWGLRPLLLFAVRTLATRKMLSKAELTALIGEHDLDASSTTFLAKLLGHEAAIGTGVAVSTMDFKLDERTCSAFFSLFTTLFRALFDSNKVGKGAAPLVVIISGVELLDQASLLFVQELFAAQRERLFGLGLAASHSFAIEHLRRALTQAPFDFVAVPLARLERAELTALLKYHFKVNSVADELVDFAFVCLHSNPALVRHYITALLKLGFVGIADGHLFCLQPFTDVLAKNVVVPPKAAFEAYFPHLERLEHEQLLVLKLAAIAGTTFELATLAKLLPFPPTQLSKEKFALLVHKLVRMGILEVLDERSAFDATLRFADQSLRDVVYHGQPFALRREFHALIATILQQRPTPSSEINTHLVQAENVLRESDLSARAIRSVSGTRIGQLLTQGDNYTASGVNVLRQGYLAKLNQGLKWAQRFFVLTSTELLYYQNEVDFQRQKPAACNIPLKAVFEVKRLDGTRLGQEVRVLVRASRSSKGTKQVGTKGWELAMKSSADAEEWISFLECAKARLSFQDFVSKYGKSPLGDAPTSVANLGEAIEQPRSNDTAVLPRKTSEIAGLREPLTQLFNVAWVSFATQISTRRGRFGAILTKTLPESMKASKQRVMTTETGEEDLPTVKRSHSQRTSESVNTSVFTYRDDKKPTIFHARVEENLIVRPVLLQAAPAPAPRVEVPTVVKERPRKVHTMAPDSEALPNCQTSLEAGAMLPDRESITAKRTDETPSSYIVSEGQSQDEDFRTLSRHSNESLVDIQPELSVSSFKGQLHFERPATNNTFEYSPISSMQSLGGPREERPFRREVPPPSVPFRRPESAARSFGGSSLRQSENSSQQSLGDNQYSSGIRPIMNMVPHMSKMREEMPLQVPFAIDMLRPTQALVERQPENRRVFYEYGESITSERSKSQSRIVHCPEKGANPVYEQPENPSFRRTPDWSRRPEPFAKENRPLQSELPRQVAPPRFELHDERRRSISQSRPRNPQVTFDSNGSLFVDSNEPVFCKPTF